MKSSGVWYIDSIDPRGGSAFITRRGPDLAEDPPALERGITAFLAPPAFQPEFLESRGPGFALARAHGQLGLFLDQKEVPFERLEEASEYVRRVYLRGSAGDTPLEGGGEGVFPLPPGEGGSPKGAPDVLSRPLPARAGDPVNLITVFVDALAPEPDNQPALGQSIASPPLLAADGAPLDAEASVKSLVRAAVTLLLQAEALSSALGPLQAEQLSSRLGRMCARMGLWSLIYDDNSWRDLKVWLKQTKLGGRWLAAQLALPPGASSDPFEDLALVPVPPALSHTGETFHTLQAVLGLMCSTPVDLRDANPETKDQLIELALFAATYLTLGREEAPLVHGFKSASLEGFFLAERMKAALAWFSLNLPRRVFAPQLEKTICQASAVDRGVATHYTTAPSGGRPPSKTPHLRIGAEEYEWQSPRRNYQQGQQGEPGLMA